MVRKLKDKFSKKLKSSDELIRLLKHLMWLKSSIRWETDLSNFRKEEHDNNIQKLIEEITTYLLQSVKENAEDTDKFE